MTEQEATRLVLTLAYNFAGFLPGDPRGAALKKGLWMDELKKVDAKRGEEAIKRLVQLLHYPPQIADFREALSPAKSEQAAIAGPVYGTKEGFEAMYTADERHRDEVMRKVLEEI